MPATDLRIGEDTCSRFLKKKLEKFKRMGLVEIGVPPLWLVKNIFMVRECRFAQIILYFYRDKHYLTKLEILRNKGKLYYKFDEIKKTIEIIKKIWKNVLRILKKKERVNLEKIFEECMENMEIFWRDFRKFNWNILKKYLEKILENWKRLSLLCTKPWATFGQI